MPATRPLQYVPEEQRLQPLRYVPEELNPQPLQYVPLVLVERRELNFGAIRQNPHSGWNLPFFCAGWITGMGIGYGAFLIGRHIKLWE
jgi:hypothetical protein